MWKRSFGGPLRTPGEITAGAVWRFKLSAVWMQTEFDRDNKKPPVAFCFTRFPEVKSMVSIPPFGLCDKDYSLIK